jgi:hypothetical protein
MSAYSQRECAKLSSNSVYPFFLSFFLTTALVVLEDQVQLKDEGLCWRYRVGKCVDCVAVEIGVDAIAVCCHDGYLYCLNIEEGTLRWRADIGDRMEIACAVDESDIYCGTMSGVVKQVSRIDGHLKASVSYRGSIKGLLCVRGVILVATDAGLFAGNVMLSSRSFLACPSLGADDGMRVLAISSCGFVLCIECNENQTTVCLELELVSKRPRHDVFLASATSTNNGYWIVSSVNQWYLLSAVDGSLLNQFQFPPTFSCFCAPCVMNDQYVLFAWRETVALFDIHSGLKWVTTLEESITSRGEKMSDSTFAFGTESGHIVVLSISIEIGATVVQSFHVCDAAAVFARPLYCDSRSILIVGTRANSVVCVQAQKVTGMK